MTSEEQPAGPELRIGSRGSALALAQVAIVGRLIDAAYPRHPWRVDIVRTDGDRDQVSPLTEIGGRGVFTSALEQAIVRGDIDAAVHSAKDLPTALHPEAPIVAFPDRDDPRDVLVSRHGVSLELLPPRPVVGTSSRRREVHIRRLRPDARTVSLRGNIDTRLGKAESGELDGIVLAAAGLRRMGWEARISQYFPVEVMVPSPAQGALAVQARLGSEAATLLAGIDDPAVSLPAGIERAFLAALGAGCTIPVGAYARSCPEGFRLLAMLADEAGRRIVNADELLAAGEECQHAGEIARRLRADLGSADGPRVWSGRDEARGADELQGARVVVTRPRAHAGPLLTALQRRGATTLALPAIRIEPMPDPASLDAALRDAAQGQFEWLVLTSGNAVAAVAGRLHSLGLAATRLPRLQVAAVGRSTAAAAAAVGLNVNVVPTTANAEALAGELCRYVGPGDRVLYPRSAIGRETVPELLRRQGVEVVTLAAYQTVAEPDIDERLLAQVRRREVDLVTFSSPSSVTYFVQMLGADREALAGVAAVCAGPVTARAADDAGFRVVAVADDPGAEAMTGAVAGYWRRQQDPGLPSVAIAEPLAMGRSGG